MFVRKSKSGFTLVEILIVVIILGILAAIVIPQFTNASQDARKSSLVSQLQTLRSQIELWKLQHGDALPNLVGASPACWLPLTSVTVYNTKNFGPYMQAPPANPLNGFSAVIDGDGTAGAAATGFVYDYNGGTVTATRGTGRIWGTDSTPTAIYAE